MHAQNCDNARGRMSECALLAYKAHNSKVPPPFPYLYPQKLGDMPQNWGDAIKVGKHVNKNVLATLPNDHFSMLTL
jgi:hypothetical protein